MVIDGLQSRGAARERPRDLLLESLGEDLRRATRLSTSKSPNHQPDPNATPVCPQIGQTSRVAAVNSPRDEATRRTGSG